MKFRSLLEITSVLCLLIYFASCSAALKVPTTNAPSHEESTNDRQLRKSITQFAKPSSVLNTNMPIVAPINLIVQVLRIL